MQMLLQQYLIVVQLIAPLLLLLPFTAKQLSQGQEATARMMTDASN